LSVSWSRLEVEFVIRVLFPDSCDVVRNVAGATSGVGPATLLTSHGLGPATSHTTSQEAVCYINTFCIRFRVVDHG
jgi:hypothetical protein